MSREARHSSESNEHYTPGYLINQLRFTFGETTDKGGQFDLDPASCDKYAPIIGARTYYTKEQDGLKQPWFGKVWLNPPGGVSPKEYHGITKSYAALWWHVLTLNYLSEKIDFAFYLGFSLEQLQSIQLVTDIQTTPLQHPTLFFNRRLQFMTQNLKPGTQPSHGNFLTLLPPRDEERKAYMLRLLTSHFRSQGQWINV